MSLPWRLRLSGNFPDIDPRAARRRFERAARSYAGASRLEAEVAARMLERLDYVKLAPRRILDAGSGPAREARSLAARYKSAAVVAVDFSFGMLRRRRGRWLGRNPAHPLCASIERLPLAAESFGLVWSNMALHWLAEPLDALKEFHRVLAPEGLLMFSMLGPDSLKELRAAAGAQRVHAFHDMHDIGDRLVAAGFSAPVMDMEMLTFTYPSAAALLADLRASGQTSARRDRARGLAGKRFLKRLREELPPRSTFEIVYGHAWKAAARAARDEPVKTIGIFRRLP
jgi:malonyl-CoA O-methyltransferase